MPALSSIVIFCADPYLMAPFWARALGLDAVEEDRARLDERSLAADESVLLKGTGRPDVWVTPVARLDPPANRLHLDLVGDDADIQALVVLGGRHLRDEPGHTVLSDPEGNQFCVLRTAHA